MTTAQEVKEAAATARDEAAKAPPEHYGTVFMKVFDALIWRVPLEDTEQTKE